jgi:hypothetical protein
MIKIEDLDDIFLIKSSVTDFVFCMTYCEHKIPFYIGGVKPSKESIERMAEGKAGHSNEEKIEEEKIEKGEIRLVENIELPWVLFDISYDLEFSREDIFTKLSHTIQVDEKKTKLVLTGRADKILRKDGYLIVQEDKFPKNAISYIDKDKPFDSQFLQALIYLNSKFVRKNSNAEGHTDYKKIIKNAIWFEIPHKDKKWIINIRYMQNNENTLIRTFEGNQNETDKIYLDNNLERFISIILGKSEKNHHGNFRKCIPCEYASICSFSLKPESG